MFLEAVIVCKGYSDFLKETLPLNLPNFDNVIVVTDHKDWDTIKLCDKLSVEHFRTDCFYDNGDTFNKGAAINLGLVNLTRKGWMVHLDADIVLCHRYRDMLARARLDENNIYGADRVNVYGWDAWQALKARIVPHYQDNWFVDPGFCHEWWGPTPKGIKFGARIIHKQHGYVPIGYHQLWNAASKYHQYNFKLGSAAGADVWFPCQWPKQNRVLLPEAVVYHLDSELTHKKGTNWKGRVSAPFGPQKKATSPAHGHGYHPHHDPWPWWWWFELETQLKAAKVDTSKIKWLQDGLKEAKKHKPK